MPISGSEEFTAGHQDYPCCTARGGVAALDANTGKQIWKTYTADEPKPWKKNPNGVQLYGPAVGGVWNAPTIDPVRGALYVGTGDAVTPPESRLSDAVMALDLKTGKVLWSRRATEDDLFMGGCAGPNKGEQCPRRWGRTTTSATRRSSRRCPTASARCSSAPRAPTCSRSTRTPTAPSSSA